MQKIVRDRAEMITGMRPILIDDEFVFCSTTDAALAARCLSEAVSMFREHEGTSFILPRSQAEELGFDCTMVMRQLTLHVYSALDGVGLTAAVASALAEVGIPCNMVAAHHHDHAFVPSAKAQTAVIVLERLSDQARVSSSDAAQPPSTGLAKNN